MLAGVKAGPGPVGSVADELGAGGVGLDIAAEGEEVNVILHGEAFEAALVEVAAGGVVVMGVVAAGVGDADPANELAEGLVGFGPDDQMPVVGHEAVGEQVGGVECQGLAQQLFKGRVVGVFMEERHAAVAAVEGVIDQTGLDESWAARHGGGI